MLLIATLLGFFADETAKIADALDDRTRAELAILQRDALNIRAQYEATISLLNKKLQEAAARCAQSGSKLDEFKIACVHGKTE